jgi:hypothetical protein
MELLALDTFLNLLTRLMSTTILITAFGLNRPRHFPLQLPDDWRDIFGNPLPCNSSVHQQLAPISTAWSVTKQLVIIHTSIPCCFRGNYNRHVIPPTSSPRMVLLGQFCSLYLACANVVLAVVIAITIDTNPINLRKSLLRNFPEFAILRSYCTFLSIACVHPNNYSGTNEL